jgi:hypothetical protein
VAASRLLASPPRLGLLSYRWKIRRRGPFAALLLPLMAFAAGTVLRNWGGSTIRGFGGFLLTVLAGPTVLLLGVPVTGGTLRYAIGAATSAAMWLLIGWWAAARATRVPVASWRDWFREYCWLAIPVWLGALAAGAVAWKKVGF